SITSTSTIWGAKRETDRRRVTTKLTRGAPYESSNRARYRARARERFLGLEQKPSVAAFVHGWFSPTVLGR
ncbi:MAG TPA: hypothetical protein VI114_03340, partial [Chthoniobacterales bacterium]